MIGKSQFIDQKLQLAKPAFRNQIKAFLEGHPKASLPEQLLETYINWHNKLRIDFLGSGQNLWSLYPPYRTATFDQQLPELITRIEQNRVPDKQRGFYDIIDEVCDWTEAKNSLRDNPWWKRILDRN